MTSHLVTGEQSRALEFNELTALSAQFKAYPMLLPEEEYELAQSVQEHGDKSAAQKLVLSHMRYVIKISKGYLSYGLPAKDIVHEGTVGLMKAVRNFQPQKGVRLVTYASHWVKAEIHEYLLKNWRLVKVATTKAQRKLFFNLRKLKKNIEWLTPDQRQSIAAELNVPEHEVSTMELRLSSQDESYDENPIDDDRPSARTGKLLSYQDDNPEALISLQQSTEQQLATLTPAIESLSTREQEVIKTRWLAEEKRSLKDLAEQFGISIERVRQIEQAAIAKLRAAF